MLYIYIYSLARNRLWLKTVRAPFAAGTSAGSIDAKLEVSCVRSEQKPDRACSLSGVLEDWSYATVTGVVPFRPW